MPGPLKSREEREAYRFTDQPIKLIRRVKATHGTAKCACGATISANKKECRACAESPKCLRCGKSEGLHFGLCKQCSATPVPISRDLARAVRGR